MRQMIDLSLIVSAATFEDSSDEMAGEPWLSAVPAATRVQSNGACAPNLRSGHPWPS